MLQKEDDLRTVCSLQKDQTDALHEVQKWATKECQMKPTCLAVGSCCSLDKARLHSTPRAAPCHVQKQQSPDGPLVFPMPERLWHRWAPRTCPKQSQELSSRHGECECPAPSTGLHFLLEE